MRPAPARLAPAEWLALGAIVALAVVLRGWRLTEQSVWNDDFPTLYFISVDSVRALIGRVQALDVHTPLYYLLAYGWSGFIGGATGLRLLGVALSVAAIPLAHAIGRRALGVPAGLLGAFFLAIGPYMIFESQAIRPYPLMLLLAVASSWAFVRSLDGHKAPRWLALNAAFNGLLVFTHVLGLLLLLPQGLALALRWRARWRIPAAWAAACAVAALPGFAYALTRMDRVTFGLSVQHHAPGVGEILGGLLGTQTVLLNLSLMPGRPPWLEEWPAVARAIEVWGTAAVAAFIAAALVWGLVETWRGRHEPGAHARLYLALLAVLPVAALALMSHLLAPVFYPRYHWYAEIAPLLFLGAAATAPASRAARSLLALMATAAIASQTLMTVPAHTRTPWIAAARVVNAEGAGGRVLASTLPEAQHAFRDSGVEARLVNTVNDALHRADCMLAPRGRQAAVWVLWRLEYAPRLLEDYATVAAGLGLRVEERYLYGLENLVLLRVTRGDSGALPPPEPPPGDDARRFLEIMGLQDAANADAPRTMWRITNAHGWRVRLFDYVGIALFAADACDLPLATAAAEVANRDWPDAEFARRMRYAVRALANHPGTDEAAAAWLQVVPPLQRADAAALLSAVADQDQAAIATLVQRLSIEFMIFPEQLLHRWGVRGQYDLCCRDRMAAGP